MSKRSIIQIVAIILLSVLGLSNLVLASSDFVIIPEADKGKDPATIVEKISTDPGDKTSVIDRYNKEGGDIDAMTGGGVGTSMATGVFTWNSILSLLKHFVTFLSNVALVIAALTIIYAGYIYATQVFVNSGGATKGKDAIVKSLMGLLIVIFAYAILRLLAGFFLV